MGYCNMHMASTCQIIHSHIFNVKKITFKSMISSAGSSKVDCWDQASCLSVFQPQVYSYIHTLTHWLFQVVELFSFIVLHMPLLHGVKFLGVSYIMSGMKGDISVTHRRVRANCFLLFLITYTIT